MKSGTNWVCRLLKTHRDVDCVGEFHWESFLDALQANVQRIAPARRQRLATIVRPELEAMVKRCLTELADADAVVIGDRTPTTIDPLIITDAPHIVMLRDFRDVIVSRMFHLYNKPRVTGVFEKFPEMKRRLEKFQQDPWFFRNHPEELLANEQIVRDSAREWSAQQFSDRQTVTRNPSLPVKFVKYEELHTDFDRQLHSLFGFLSIESPASIPDALLPGHDVERPDHAQRKGMVGDWDNYMTDTAKLWINQEAGPELIRHGYIDSENW